MAKEKSEKGAGTAELIEAGGNLTALAFSTIASVSDANQRRKFSQNLDLLTSEQQNALNKALLDAGSETERLKILKEVLTDLQAKRIDLLVASVTEKERKTRTNTYIAAGAFILVGIALVALIVKKA